MSATAVFDIGKTNKKFLVYDEDLRLLHQEQVQLPEIEDEDGFPTEDLPALVDWMRQTLSDSLHTPDYTLDALNVTTYGASLVHLDAEGRVVTPLYNYLKPLPDKTRTAFYQRHGDRDTIARETASPPLGMLNAGLQLVWLKYERPDAFAQIDCSLHLPQYLSFLFSDRKTQEFTSLGCHTALWHYERADYHPWVYDEGLDRLFPRVGPTTRTFDTTFDGKPLRVGTGVHDSSAALLPYLHHARSSFVLLSTGTWSIALNPYSEAPLTGEELARDALFYLRPDGERVRAARLFLGREHDLQVAALAEHFQVDPERFFNMPYRREAYRQLRREGRRFFQWAQLDGADGELRLPPFPRYFTPSLAYHQLMIELVDRQVEQIRLAHPEGDPATIFIDGGFSSNDLLVHMLARKLPASRVQTVQSAQGTALGAALCVQPNQPQEGWLSEHFVFETIGR